MVVVFPLLTNATELRWDWNTIDTTAVQFNKEFVWGTATSAYQIEGGCINNWSMWEQSQKLEPAGKACDGWNNCFKDISLLKQLGVKAYRFSVEWSRIEPICGYFDHVALQRYKDFCRALKENGIEPMVTLHHFTNPLWFQEKKAFEKEKNIHYFVRFSTTVFEELKDYVSMWCTVNEPSVYAFCGYILGTFPPGQKADFRTAGIVLKNFLIAHCQTYQTLKERAHDLGISIQVGLAHNILQFEPYKDRIIEKALCTTLTKNLSDAVVTFFATGRFEFSCLPSLHCTGSRLSSALTYTNPNAPDCLDFIGLNYYCNVLLDIASGKEGYRAGDIKTDMPYPIYAEGLYRALHRVRILNKMIYVTENGIADAKDDRRDIWLKRYIYAMYKAQQEGCDVRGYFYWSLLDNFEWAYGYSMKFGLYEVNRETMERTLRPGADWFVRMAKTT